MARTRRWSRAKRGDDTERLGTMCHELPSCLSATAAAAAMPTMIDRQRRRTSTAEDGRVVGAEDRAFADDGELVVAETLDAEEARQQPASTSSGRFPPDSSVEINATAPSTPPAPYRMSTARG